MIIVSPPHIDMIKMFDFYGIKYRIGEPSLIKLTEIDLIPLTKIDTKRTKPTKDATMKPIIPDESGFIKGYKIYRNDPAYPGLQLNEEYFIHLKDAMNSVLPYWQKIPETAWREEFDNYINLKYWITEYMETGTGTLVIKEILIDTGDDYQEE